MYAESATKPHRVHRRIQRTAVALVASVLQYRYVSTLATPVSCLRSYPLSGASRLSQDSLGPRSGRSGTLLTTLLYHGLRREELCRLKINIFIRGAGCRCQFQLTSAFSSANRCTKNIELIRVQAPDSRGIRSQSRAPGHRGSAKPTVCGDFS